MSNLKEALELYYEDAPVMEPRTFYTTTLEVGV